MESIIKARKHDGVQYVFTAINRRMLARHFHQIWTCGFEKLAAIDRNRPVIFYANHSNWWDGLIAQYLSYKLLKLDPYLIMLARQLRKYFFFSWVGAFSVDPESPVSSYRSLEYAASLLNAQNGRSKRCRALWIFPQGEMLPNDVRPLTFMRGLGWLVERVPQAQTVSVALRYEFLNEQLPEVFLSFEEPVDIDQEAVSHRKQFVAQKQSSLTAQLDRLRDDVVNRRLTDYRPIMKGGASLNIIYERAIRFFRR